MAGWLPFEIQFGLIQRIKGGGHFADPIRRQQDFATTMLGRGARATYHFSEWVGGDAHITSNYSTFEELFAQNPPIEDRIHAQDSEDLITELREKVPDFRRAYDDGLALREFENFAPLRRFRKNFFGGCDDVLQEITKRRRVVA